MSLEMGNQEKPNCYSNFFEHRDKSDKCSMCSIKELCKFDSGAFNKKTGETFTQFKKRARREKKINKIYSFFSAGAFVLLIFGVIGIVGYASVKGIQFLPSLISSASSLISEISIVGSPMPVEHVTKGEKLEGRKKENATENLPSQIQITGGHAGMIFWSILGMITGVFFIWRIFGPIWGIVSLIGGIIAIISRYFR